MTKTRDEALALLHEYTKSESLIKHCLAVESAMRWYANHFALDAPQVEIWGITGLLHDFDYEMYPDPVAPNGHPFKGNQILRELGYSNDLTTAIMGHALYTNVPRETQMAQALFAVDELCGLITAAVYVRPDRSLHNLEVKSVRKRMKEKTFAQGVNREDIILGAAELGIELDQHIANTISGMRAIASELGLAGK